jgi:hypothetical protein
VFRVSGFAVWFLLLFFAVILSAAKDLLLRLLRVPHPSLFKGGSSIPQRV